MRIKGVQHRLDFLTRQLSAAEWRLLTAIAVELELGLSKVVRLASTFGVALRAAKPKAVTLRTQPAFRPRIGRDGADSTPAGPAEELAEWLRSGLLVEAGRTRSPTLTSTSTTEPVYAVASEFRQLVVRQSALKGELEAVVEATHGLLGERSLGPFALLLQAGRASEFQRYTYSLPKASGRLGEELRADEILREAIVRPFDPAWFEATWQREALPVAERVLREALPELHECDELFEWLRVQLETGGVLRARSEGTAAGVASTASVSNTAASSEAALHEVTCEHAVLRGRLDVLEAHLPGVPSDQRFALSVAAHYQSGDLDEARRLLEDDESSAGGFDAEGPSEAPLIGGARREKKRARGLTPEVGAVAPLLALIAYGRGSARTRAEAKRWLSPRGTDGASSGAERAFRTLLRYGSQTDSEYARLDVHQLARNASAWELVILGLTVHLHLTQEVTRAAWAVQLVRSGAAWIEAGYSWLGRQALFLAQALSRDYFAREFEGVKGQLFLESFEARPGELALCDLITLKPDWERALDALEQLAEQPSGDSDGARRVAWYIDMVNGSLDRPALQELKQGGWTRGRRVPLVQLHALGQELPPEDLAVLLCTQPSGEDREFTPEAIEALIGHPRVYNGSRGGVQVEVSRGTARIETVDQGGFLMIRVEPTGARLGVNVVVENEARLVVYRVNAAMQRVIDVLPDGLRVPKEREKQALSVLGKLSHGVEVQSRHLGADRQVEADATPCLRIAPHAGAWLVQGGVRPFGSQGRFFVAGTGRRSISLYSGGERLLCSRDLELERARLSRLILDCPTLLERTLDPEGRAPKEALESWDFGQAELLEVLLELRTIDERFEIEWPESDALRVRGHVTSKSLHGILRRKKGWYLMTGGIKLDGEELEIAIGELAGATVVDKGRFIRLPNGDFLAIEERVRRVMLALENTEVLSQRPRELKIHEGALNVLRVLGEFGAGDEPGVGFDLDDETRAWLSRVESLERQEFAVPSTLDATLRSYQLDGFRWLSYLSALGLGACLADDMGLGKTVEILALLLTRLDQGPTLVVAPTSVCANWLREAARFAPTLRSHEYGGPDRDELFESLKDPETAPQLIVCSYGLLQQDVDALAGVEWGTVVLDEAQFIKNAESQRARAACRLQARFRVAATGTPVENHLGDLWSIFNFLNPGLLGPWRSFNHRYLKPIERSGNTAVRQLLQEQIKPFILRRTKSEVLADLPALTLVHHSVTLSESEARGYALLKRQIHDKLHTVEGRRDNKLEILAEITRLRRFCCHPRLVFPEADSDASKVQALLDLVLELRENQHRALVFSQFVDFLDLVRQRLDEAGVTYQYLDGSTPKAQRQARVDAFQTGEGTLFLISLKAGGFGLNLTAADYVIHLDPWWNPAVEAQATDRAHRIGQERPVTVYRLITKDTIEEQIVELHQSKQALADSLLTGGNEAANLSARELVGLIERDLVSSAAP
jgi:superfamily II DNA or RNA helicase